MFNFVDLNAGVKASCSVYPVIVIPFLLFIILLLIIKRM